MPIRKITYDGQRSMKRKFFAEKEVDKLTMLQLPVKKVNQWDGFRFQTNNVLSTELKSSHITAPTGVVVICSSYNGVYVLEMDYWRGPAMKKSRMKALDYLMKQYDVTGNGEGTNLKVLLNGQSEEEILASYPYLWAGRMRCVRQGSYYDLLPGGAMDTNSYQFPDDWPAPVAFPDMSERYWMSFCGTDLMPEDNDNIYGGTTTQETFFCPYDNDGSRVGGRTSFLEQVLWTERPTAITQYLPATIGMIAVRPVVWLYYFFDEKRYYATITRYIDNTTTYERVNLESILAEEDTEGHHGAVMPEELRSIVLEDTSCTCRPTGSYIYSLEPDKKPAILNVIDLSNSDNSLNNNGADVGYFSENPGQRKWKLSIHINDTETNESYSFSAEQFLALLDSRSLNLPVGTDLEDADYGNANDILWQFFGRPTHSFATPHDTVTFHAEDNNIYTWTRFYGVVKFTRDGLFGVDEFVVPGIVTSNEGIRPTIRYAGKDAEGYGFYSCVCENLEEPKTVHALYYGSPFFEKDFANWVPLPIPSTEQGELIHVRVAFHDQEGIILFGILRLEKQTDGGLKNFYFLANLVYSVNNIENTWVVSSVLPVDIIDPVFGERASWDICTYGGEELVPGMRSYLSPPAAHSQTPCGPYDGYKRGLP